MPVELDSSPTPRSDALLADKACTFESPACTLAFWQHILLSRYIKGAVVVKAVIGKPSRRGRHRSGCGTKCCRRRWTVYGDDRRP